MQFRRGALRGAPSALRPFVNDLSTEVIHRAAPQGIAIRCHSSPSYEQHRHRRRHADIEEPDTASGSWGVASGRRAEASERARQEATSRSAAHCQPGSCSDAQRRLTKHWKPQISTHESRRVHAAAGRQLPDDRREALPVRHSRQRFGRRRPEPPDYRRGDG